MIGELELVGDLLRTMVLGWRGWIVLGRIDREAAERASIRTIASSSLVISFPPAHFHLSVSTFASIFTIHQPLTGFSSTQHSPLSQPPKCTPPAFSPSSPPSPPPWPALATPAASRKPRAPSLSAPLSTSRRAKSSTQSGFATTAASSAPARAKAARKTLCSFSKTALLFVTLSSVRTRRRVFTVLVLVTLSLSGLRMFVRMLSLSRVVELPTLLVAVLIRLPIKLSSIMDAATSTLSTSMPTTMGRSTDLAVTARVTPSASDPFTWRASLLSTAVSSLASTPTSVTRPPTPTTATPRPSARVTTVATSPTASVSLPRLASARCFYRLDIALVASVYHLL